MGPEQVVATEVGSLKLSESFTLKRNLIFYGKKVNLQKKKTYLRSIQKSIQSFGMHDLINQGKLQGVQGKVRF